MSKTSIEWTEQTWNPIVGCSIVSPGCTNCYAMKMAARIEAMGNQPRYAGTTKKVKGNAVWTGKLAQAPESTLLQPLKRHAPTTYFVNSMGDLFHEDCPDEWIDRVFAVMALAQRHTFQVLTKRAARMRDYFAKPVEREGMIDCSRADRVGDVMLIHHKIDSGFKRVSWPLPNVWLGVSTERQQEADERIPLLLQTPAAIRFISAEPLLGPLNLTRCGSHYTGSGPLHLWQAGGDKIWRKQFMEPPPEIDWVIVGGESGPGARPMHPGWARSLRDQCATAGVPLFFKQWGAWLPGESNHGQFDPRPMHAYRRCDNHSYKWPNTNIVQNFGTHEDRWSGSLTARRVGKKAAGRLLDGIEHNGFPQVTA